MNDKKIVIYGWTFMAERFRYIYAERGDIVALVSEELPDYWYGVKTISENEFLLNYESLREDVYVFIAYSFESGKYKDIRNKLEYRGGNEFEHFWSVEAYAKKMVLINANCHVEPYAKYLLGSKRFCDKYYIYPLEAIHSRKLVEIPEYLLKVCDVFIYQIISEKNPYSKQISTNYTLAKLREDCKRIAVPNFAGGIDRYEKFHFPQLDGQNLMHPRINYELGIFPNRDLIIENCIQRGEGIEKIIELYMDENLISQQEIRDAFAKFLNALKSAEKKWSFKISDFLEQNNNGRILATLGHPSKEVLRETGKRILRELDINENVAFEYEFMDEYPILKCVSKALGMREEEFIRKGENRKENILCDADMDLEEYVKEYIYWTHGLRAEALLKGIKQVIQGREFILYRPTRYIKQVLNIMGERLTDTLENYEVGIPVIIMAGELGRIRMEECLEWGCSVKDIYIAEMWDPRKKDLSRLLEQHSKVVIYGMGNDFQYLINEANNKIAICDKKIGTDYQDDGIEYWSVETLMSKRDEDICVYITSTLYGLEIQEELKTKGYAADKIVLNVTDYEQVMKHWTDVMVVPLENSDLWYSD